jgi:hypothetical protein
MAHDGKGFAKTGLLDSRFPDFFGEPSAGQRKFLFFRSQVDASPART